MKNNETTANSSKETGKILKVILKFYRFLIPVVIVGAILIIWILFISTFIEKGNAAILTKWTVFVDDLGSNIKLTQDIEYIEKKYIQTFIISGYSPYKDAAYTGVNSYPSPSINKAIFKAKRFSFTVLGDGKTYTVMLPTKETRLEGGLNHYRKEFTTENGVVSTFIFNIDELYQSPYFGKEVPFVQKHIEAFQIQTYSKGDFNLKFWNVRFY